MQIFNIELGQMNLYSLKNFSFEIQNNGSADLQIDNITSSSTNISLLYTNTPFYILQNTAYTLSGYLKIITHGDSTNAEYIDLHISYVDQLNVKHNDVYRYYLNYKGNLVSKYTEIISTNKILYINNMLVLNLEVNETFETQEYPDIILKSIDNENLYIFPKVYRITDNCITYVYRDNNLLNRIISNNIYFNIIFKNDKLDIGNISFRSI